MPRPQKTGLEYIQLDVNFFDDDKILLAQELIDPGGKDHWMRFAVGRVAVQLLVEILKESYFINWTDRIALIKANKMGGAITLGNLKKIISCLVESGFFSADIFNKYSILTSHGIQKRWYSISKSCHRKNILIISEINLISDVTSKVPTKSEETPEKSEETPEKSEETLGKQRFSAEPYFPFNNTSNVDNKGISKLSIKEENKEKEKSEETPEKSEETPEKSEETPEKSEETPEKSEETIKLTESDLTLLRNMGEDFITQWERWENYRFKEHNKKYKSLVSKQAAIDQLVRMSGYNEIKAIEIMKTTIANGWANFWYSTTENQLNTHQNGSKNGVPKPSGFSGNDPLEDQQKKYTRRKRD